MHGTSQSVFLFRLGSCGAFNEEVALLAEGQLVESCKYKFLWYEEYCMYQGVCPDWVYSLFGSSPCPICSILHSTGNTGTSYKALSTHSYGVGKTCCRCISRQYPFLKCQAKDGFCPMFCSCADHFLQRSLWADPSGIVHECRFIWSEHEWLNAVSVCYVLRRDIFCLIPALTFLEENTTFQTMASLLLKPHLCLTAWASHYFLVLMHKPVQPSKLYSA